ncbi:MAG: flippase [Patescibacteria group bacterium]
MQENFWRLIYRLTPLSWHQYFDQSGWRRYFGNTSWLFLAQLVSLVISFFIGVIIARRLGPELYGTLNYALSLTTILGIFFCFGIDAAMNRELIKYPEKEKSLLGTFWVIKLLGGFLTLASVIFISIWKNFDVLTFSLVVLFAFVFIGQSFNVITLFFQARVESKKSSLAQIGASLVSLSLKIIWLFSSLNLLVLAIIYLSDVIFNSLFLILYYRRGSGSLRQWRFDCKVFRNIITSGGLLMFSGVAILAILKIDQVIIGQFLGKTEVGFYAVADRLTEVWDFIPRLICLSLFTAIINAYRTDIKLYRRRVRRLYQLMLVLSISLTILILLISRPLIMMLFGPEYEPSVAVLRVYVLSLPGIFLFTAANQRLVAENREKIILLANLSGLTLNIVLNFLFLPRFGLIGSAWATVVTFTYLTIFMVFRPTRQQPNGAASLVEPDKTRDVNSISF